EKFLPDILEEHLETLQVLWDRRRSAPRNGKETLKRLSDLDERIVAHMDGLVLAYQDAMPLLQKGLGSDEVSVALTSALVLLRMEREHRARQVLAAFQQAEGGNREGIGLALRYGPLRPLLPDLRKLLASAPDDKAVAVAEILAFRSHLDLSTQQMNRFLRH